MDNIPFIHGILFCSVHSELLERSEQNLGQKKVESLFLVGGLVMVSCHLGRCLGSPV